MRRKTFIIGIVIISMFIMVSCGKSEFGCVDISEKFMSIEAVNADKESFFMTGTLEIDEGEQVIIISDLEKGSVELDFVAASESSDIESAPDLDLEALFTADASGSETQSYNVDSGNYMVRAVVTEKATGKITIEIKPVD